MKKLREWISSDLPCLVIETEMGHLCGYVGIDASHPLFDVHYSADNPVLGTVKDIRGQAVGDRGVMSLLGMAMKDEASLLSPEDFFDVHGSITYSRMGGPENVDGLFFYGFDCAHAGDEDEDWSLEPVAAECERFAAQIAAVKA